MSVPLAPPPATEYLDATGDAVPAPPPRGGVEELLAVLRELHASETDLDRALHLIVERARWLLGTDLAWAGRIDDGLLTVEHAAGEQIERLLTFRDHPAPASRALSGTALERQHTLVVTDYPASSQLLEPRVRKEMLATGVVSMMLAPMFRGTRLIGYLNVANRHPTAFAPVHSSLLSTLAAQASVAILNSSLRRELRTRNALLTDSLAIHREMTASALHGLGVAGLLESLERRLGRRIELTSVADPAPAEDADVGVRLPVLAGDDCLGWLTVHGGPLAPLALHALEHAASALALALLDTRAGRDAEQRMRSELLEEMVHATGAASPRVAERSARLGHDASAPVRLLAVAALVGRDERRPSDGHEQEGVHQAVRELLDGDALARGAQPPLTYHRGSRTVAALPVADREVHAARWLHEQLAARGWTVAIGVSRASTDLAAARAEAFGCLDLALEAGRPAIVDGERLGSLRFLLDAPSSAAASEHVRRHLGVLVEAERRSRAPLLETMRAYVEADGHQQTVAARCAIHVNTLKYRVARIESVLGSTLRDIDRRFELRLAFALLDLLESLGLDPLERGPAAQRPTGSAGSSFR